MEKVFLHLVGECSGLILGIKTGLKKQPVKVLNRRFLKSTTVHFLKIWSYMQFFMRNLVWIFLRFKGCHISSFKGVKLQVRCTIFQHHL